MGSFSLIRKALSDLKSIATYTQRKWGREQRRIYANQFDDTFRTLSEAHSAGTECDYIKQGYRKFPVASHIVFYRNKNQSEIEIVRALHKRMDARSTVEKASQ